MRANFEFKYVSLVILLWHFVEVQSSEAPFLDQYEANNFLRRSRRSNSLFEEFFPGNLERECIEESCSLEEATEISDAKTQGDALWEKYTRCIRAQPLKKSKTNIRIRHARDLKRTVDERISLRNCILDTDQCKPFPCVRSNTVSCEDSINSYECVCKSGFMGRKCESPINECSSNPCHGSARCEDEIGGFRCVCDSLHEGILCETDISDCRNVPSKRCGPHGNCLQLGKNAPYQCICHPGYEGERCTEDIDECDGTPCQQNCTNTEGSFQCSCQDGFILDLKTRTSCKDVDECDISNNCEHICHNTEGGYECRCRGGYKLDDTFSRYCEDVDECATENGGCPVIQGICGLERGPCETCHNTDGQYVCFCPVGFTAYVKGHECEDIDECELGDHGCGQDCENILGSYRCLCREGYKLSFNQKTCIDVNECLRDDVCEDRCINIPGSYKCTCGRGYEVSPDGRSCVDVNECATNETRCSHTCMNTVGSYACGCKPGFRLVGKYRCYDINDCSGTPCGRNGRCHDGVNSYTCECRRGFRGLHCEIDENPCSTNPCQNGGTCLREETGFSCSCVAGFTGNTCEEQFVVCDEGYVVQENQCIDVDECLEEGICGQNCRNVPGSFFCTCDDGYEADRNQCTDIDECKKNLCEQICSNSPGTFVCSCDDGYVLRSDQRGCDRTYSCLNSEIEILSYSHLLLGTFQNDYIALDIQSLESIFSLSFDYRTLDPDALLLAMIDRPSQRYIFISLLAGRLQVSARFNDQHIVTTEAFSADAALDANWHQVSIKKKRNRLRVLKDDKKLKDLRFSSDDFGSVNTLYYGGLPTDIALNSNNNQYANKRLQGCLRKMSYSGLQVINTSVPTMNKGCFETIGPGMFFNGTGYASAGIPEGSSFRLRFNFKSRVPSGTIARVKSSDGTQFSLEIDGNQLIAQVTSEEHRYSTVYTAGNVEVLCDNVWHICDVTVTSDRITLHVDGLEAQRRNLDGMRDVELSGDVVLYLGGGPDDSSFFEGSLRNFEHNNSPLDLGTLIELNGVHAYSIPLP